MTQYKAPSMFIRYSGYCWKVRLYLKLIYNLSECQPICAGVSGTGRIPPEVMLSGVSVSNPDERVECEKNILLMHIKLPEGRALWSALPLHDMLNGIGIDIVVGDGVCDCVGVCVSDGIGLVHDMVDILWKFTDRHIDWMLIAE